MDVISDSYAQGPQFANEGLRNKYHIFLATGASPCSHVAPQAANKYVTRSAQASSNRRPLRPLSRYDIILPPSCPKRRSARIVSGPLTGSSKPGLHHVSLWDREPRKTPLECCSAAMEISNCELLGVIPPVD